MIHIVIIRIIAAILFFTAFIISSRISSKIKESSTIWLLISSSLLIIFAESIVNALQWANIFPEVVSDKVIRIQGMNITFVIHSSNREASLYLLYLMGVPFRDKDDRLSLDEAK